MGDRARFLALLQAYELISSVWAETYKCSSHLSKLLLTTGLRTAAPTEVSRMERAIWLGGRGPGSRDELILHFCHRATKLGKYVCQLYVQYQNVKVQRGYFGPRARGARGKIGEPDGGDLNDTSILILWVAREDRSETEADSVILLRGSQAQNLTMQGILSEPSRKLRRQRERQCAICTEARS